MRQGEPTLRLLGMADAQAYRTLRLAVLGAHPSAFTSDVEQERRRTLPSYRDRLDPARADDGHFTLGAWIDDTLVGVVSCERESRARGRHVAQLLGMMVADAQQGRGIGGALLDGCLAQARRVAGLELLTLSVTDGNRTAIGLYERAGFQRYGTLDRAIRVDDRYLPKHLMALAL